jgi:NADH pyrophosphatase NudC (nudix superfamily)
MSDIFSKIRSGAGKVAFEADKVAHVKRIELDIGQLKRQVEGHYQRLGEVTYLALVNKEPEKPEVAEIYAKITDLVQRIAVKEEEIKKINAGTYQPESASQTQQAPGVSPGKRFCSNCGKENDASVKFCSECGTKMA